MERRVPVEPGDTPASLAARVFAAECLLYPEAIAAYLHDNPWMETVFMA
jgi:phosphoribosylglycinamide formyltransferase-1